MMLTRFIIITIIYLLVSAYVLYKEAKAKNLKYAWYWYILLIGITITYLWITETKL